MKKLIAVLLVVLVLTGCTVHNTESTVTSTVTPVPSTSAASTTTAPTVSTSPTTEPEPTEPLIPDYPTCSGHEGDPYVNVDVEQFYANYTTACCYTDACYRTEHHLMSGSLEVPQSEATISENRPTVDGQLARNTDTIYLDDGNTYVLVDDEGNFVSYIFKGAAYITLEEVAAYLYAFGGSNDTLPANYDSNKKASPASSEWGVYLRVNHSKFKGDVKKYPKEPEMPNIDGCGGELSYFELDIGTSTYNNGNKISRGASRIVYSRCDLNGDGVYSNDEVYIFYTCNHYSDFREYLNYQNGWGEIFGYNTGLSLGQTSPSAYPQTAYLSFREIFGA